MVAAAANVANTDHPNGRCFFNMTGKWHAWVSRANIRKAWLYRDIIGMQRDALTWDGKGGQISAELPSLAIKPNPDDLVI